MRHEDVRLSPKLSLSEDFSPGFCPKFNSEGEIGDSLTLIKEGKLENL